VQLRNNCAAMEVVTTFFQPCTNGVCNMGEGNPHESFAISATSVNGLSPPNSNHRSENNDARF
jgi:hypothetical protein